MLPGPQRSGRRSKAVASTPIGRPVPPSFGLGLTPHGARSDARVGAEREIAPRPLQVLSSTRGPGVIENTPDTAVGRMLERKTTLAGEGAFP